MVLHKTRLYGRPLSQILSLIANTSSILSNETSMEVSRLGGWSNVNLLVQYDDQKSVIKLPVNSLDISPIHYKQVAQSYLALSKVGLSPKVLDTGFLKEISLPFMILEYIEGTVYSSPNEIHPNEFIALRSALDKLNSLRLLYLPYYPDALSFYKHLLAEFQSLSRNPLLPERIRNIAPQAVEASHFLQDKLDGMHWTCKVMHGDLSESNIVFTAHGAVLLDLDSLSIGEPLFDIAYLSVQNANIVLPWLPDLSIVDDHDLMSSLRSLAVLSVLSWSLVRLAQMEQRVIEKSLASRGIRSALYQYIVAKLGLLKSLRQTLM